MIKLLYFLDNLTRSTPEIKALSFLYKQILVSYLSIVNRLRMYLCFNLLNKDRIVERAAYCRGQGN